MYLLLTFHKLSSPGSCIQVNTDVKDYILIEIVSSIVYLFFIQNSCLYTQHAYRLREQGLMMKTRSQGTLGFKVHQLIQWLNPASRSILFLQTVVFNFYKIIESIYK